MSDGANVDLQNSDRTSNSSEPTVFVRRRRPSSSTVEKIHTSVRRARFLSIFMHIHCVSTVRIRIHSTHVHTVVSIFGSWGNLDSSVLVASRDSIACLRPCLSLSLSLLQ